ncbi:MAG: magnesium transporter [Defluviitaleaceae bacterium]|nr:magnesium transporter [Defluviitaleaceae bacterium]
MDKNILSIIKDRQFDDLQVLFAHMNAVDIADALEHSDAAAAVEAFRIVDERISSDVFSYLSADRQHAILGKLSDNEVMEIMEDLSVDDMVDFVEDAPDDVANRVFEAVSDEKSEIVDRILDYPDDSAGSIMTTEIVELAPLTTVKDALHTIRTSGVDKETIYTCYVIDDERKLIGAVTADTLLYSRLNESVGDLMDVNIISANVDDDREELATKFSKYDLLAMPVINRNDRLVGIVTIDDILRVITEEDTEDFSKIAGVKPTEVPYMKTGVLAHAKSRIIWLITLLVTAAVAGIVLGVFEDSLEQMAILVAFTPMLMGAGGNAGAQSATLVIRGMALGEIVKSDLAKLIWRETRIAIICAAILGLANFARIFLMYSGREYTVTLAWVVSLSLAITLIVSKTIGCALPIVAKQFKMDPAVMAAPLITAIVDCAALIVFYFIARSAFGI